MPPSSSGLGYMVLIHVTGVRFPLGVVPARRHRAGEHLNSGTGEDAKLRSTVLLLKCSTFSNCFRLIIALPRKWAEVNRMTQREIEYSTQKGKLKTSKALFYEW